MNPSVPGRLADPRFSLVSEGTITGESDDWSNDPGAIRLASPAYRGFAPGAPMDAALLVDLDSGAHTAVLEGGGAGGTGIGIVEFNLP